MGQGSRAGEVQWGEFFPWGRAIGLEKCKWVSFFSMGQGRRAGEVQWGESFFMGQGNRAGEVEWVMRRFLHGAGQYGWGSAMGHDEGFAWGKAVGLEKWTGS